MTGVKTTLWPGFAMLLLAILTGCAPYEVQFEGPYDDSKNTAGSYIPNEILTVENGQIRLYPINLTEGKTLSNLPAGIEKASINHAHTRIAYKIPGQNIVIIDTAGASIDVVANSAAASWFDWHVNNQTLYMLNGTTLSFWGPAVSVISTNLSNFFPQGSTDRTMSTVAIAADGTVVATYRYFSGSSVGRMGWVSLAGAVKAVNLTSSNETGRWMRVSREGDIILCGTTFGTTSINNFRLNLTQDVVTQPTARSFAAPGPSNDLLVYATSGKLNISDTNSGTVLNRNINTASLTALDW
ncbi:MAG TPA: hypothetical protein PK198_23365 [Saprospiraceae bacterium]|nr:hypothetical protein [Saprospiraceae bacterium]HRJ14117.1 hypothetical protein [Saprospiraceae bacterium]HRK83574.1 hypothetical protein [Saprospiraceae bacterium]